MVPFHVVYLLLSERVCRVGWFRYSDRLDNKKASWLLSADDSTYVVLNQVDVVHVLGPTALAVYSISTSPIHPEIPTEGLSSY